MIKNLEHNMNNSSLGDDTECLLIVMIKIWVVNKNFLDLII